MTYDLITGIFFHLLNHPSLIVNTGCFSYFCFESKLPSQYLNYFNVCSTSQFFLIIGNDKWVCPNYQDLNFFASWMLQV